MFIGVPFAHSCRNAARVEAALTRFGYASLEHDLISGDQLIPVTPAKAEVQGQATERLPWISAFASPSRE